MAYTPELSQIYSGALRRLAWALKMPMTKALEEVFDHISKVIDAKKVCEACRDTRFCNDCPFNHRGDC